MTPEEQDVYAWMGISPLILANREVKNPRNTRIAIVLPGEAPPPEATTTATTTAATITLEPEALEQESAPDNAEFEKESMNAFATLIEGDDLVVPGVEQESEAEDDAHPVTRRRRRRSSATADDD
jgi:ribonuclease E